MKPLSYILLFVIILTGCRKDPTDMDPGSKYFVSATSIGTYTKTELQAFAAKAGFGNFVRSHCMT